MSYVPYCLVIHHTFQIRIYTRHLRNWRLCHVHNMPLDLNTHVDPDHQPRTTTIHITIYYTVQYTHNTSRTLFPHTDHLYGNVIRRPTTADFRCNPAHFLPGFFFSIENTSVH